MTERLARITSILVADARERLRRTSTLVAFLGICFAAYLWVPDLSTGRGLMVSQGHRAAYNSAAIALATGLLCSFLFGLLGFYGVSRSIGADLRRRTGPVIAATPVASWEYLLGKALGNFSFLLLLASGYMVSSMAMQVVRSDLPLEPSVYVAHYLFLVPPSLLFTAVMALLFETVPGLSGKAGDVLYFFLWMPLLIVAVFTVERTTGGPSWVFAFDITGLASTVWDLRRQIGSGQFSIGASPFDPALEPFVYNGFSFGAGWIFYRLLALLVPVPLFFLALLGFHRFDPARVRGDGGGRGKGYVKSLQSLLRRPAAALAGPLLGGVGRRPGLVGATLGDVALSWVENPIGFVALAVVLVGGLVAPLPAVLGSLPWIVAGMAVVVAGAATRESSCGTRAFVYAAPRLRPFFVGWKLAGSFALCLLFVLPAAARCVVAQPGRSLSLVGGAFFVASAATALGSLTGSSKAFLAAFLLFWYLTLNDGGRSPMLDFAGIFGAATPRTVGTYLVLSGGLLAIAQVAHLRRVSA